jgi:Acetylglutamate semialdehyde dehydrogenase
VGKKLKVAVAGANGYAGMTLVHLLARHPGVELSQLTSRSFAGQPYGSVFPLLEIDGTFRSEPEPDGVDVVFSCLPHNVGATKAAGWLAAGARVVDMSADFRSRTPLNTRSGTSKSTRRPLCCLRRCSGCPSCTNRSSRTPS